MKNLSKHLMTVASDKLFRQVLTGVHFNADTNKIIATDSHRLLSVKHSGKISETKTINLNTLEEIEGDYPDTSRLISYKGSTFKLNMKHITTELIKNLTKNKKNIVLVAFMENGIVIEADTKNKQEIVGDERFIGTLLVDESTDFDERERKVYMNGEYLRDMFNFLKDYNSSTDETYVTIHCKGSVRPIIVTSQDDTFDYLVTPIRLDK